MADLTYPSYKNYPAEKAYVYPAANRNDGGEDNSEKNLRTLTDKFAIKSFIVKRDLPSDEKEYFNITFNRDSTADTMFIDRGECSIRGFYLNLEDISIGAKEVGLKVDTLYNITIFCVLDSSGLLSGDGRNIVGSQSGKIVSRGVRVQLLTSKELKTLDSRYPYLLLGTIRTTVNGLFDTDSLKMDPSRYTFVDSSTIMTQSGLPIEVWVDQRIMYETTHLDQISLYKDPENEHPAAFLKIVENLDEQTREEYPYDVVFTSKEGTEISLVQIENRTVLSDSDQYTSVSSDLKKEEVGTWNGVSRKTAREDHLHDSRYLHLIESIADQIVKSPVLFKNVLKTLGGVSGTGFSISDDGSASFSHEKLKFDKDGNVSAFSLTAEGDITAYRVFNSIWNDYAEFYRKDEPGKVIEPGTVIAKVPGKETYGPVTDNSRNLVVGVCSDTYGHIVGGDKSSAEDNMHDFIPVALAGRVPVKVVKGALVKEGDLMVASPVTGRATSCTFRDEQYGVIIGKALESSDGNKDKVLIQVFLG